MGARRRQRSVFDSTRPDAKKLEGLKELGYAGDD